MTHDTAAPTPASRSASGPSDSPARPASVSSGPSSPCAEDDRAARRRAFLAGFRRAAVVTPSFAPFALVCGMAAVQAGLGEAGALGLATLVYGGSAQAVFVQYLASGAPLWVAILSGLVLNLRMAVYGADIASVLGPTTRRQRLLWSVFLIDQSYLLYRDARDRGEFRGHELAFHLGCTAALWPGWIVLNAAGAFLGAQIPSGWELEFAVPLSFVVMVAPRLRTLPVVAAAVVGGVAGVLLVALPLRLGLIAAGLLGALVATVIELRTARRAGAPGGGR